MRIKHYGLLLALICFLASGCKAPPLIEDADNIPARTYYDSLDLETPEAAMETFVSVFQRRDFATVYMILAPAAQQTLKRNMALLIRDGIVANPSEEFREAWHKRLFNLEHIYDTLHYHDLITLTAAEHAALQIHLPGPVTILDTASSINSIEQTVIDIITQVEGINGEVVFRLVQSLSGRWRVLQVIWPGGDPTQIPWAVPLESSNEWVNNEPQLHADEARTYYDTLNLSDPEAAVRTFAESFEQKDFPTVFWILYPTTQFKWVTEYGMFRYENIVKIDHDSSRQLLLNTQMYQNLYALDLVDASRDEAHIIASEMTSPMGSITERNSSYTPLVVEHIGDASYIFDQIMLAADDQYLIDLRQPTTILETIYQDSPDGETTALVSASLEGMEGELVFRLKQAPSGRWRVLQVIAPGGDEMLYPWAAPRVAD